MFSFKINFFQSFNKIFEDFIHKKPQNLDYLDLSLIPETERRRLREKKLKLINIILDTTLRFYYRLKKEPKKTQKEP
jgi:hypothetical protein